MAATVAADLTVGMFIRTDQDLVARLVRGPRYYALRRSEVHYEVQYENGMLANLSWETTERVEVITDSEGQEHFQEIPEWALASVVTKSNAEQHTAPADDPAPTETIQPARPTQPDNPTGDTDMPTAPAKSKKKAPAKKAPAKASSSGTPRRKLGETGHLQDSVLQITEDFAAGKISLEKDKKLTPHVIAGLVEESGRPKPSTGAVAAVLARWANYGFAVISEKPVAFVKFTAKGKKDGLDALKKAHRASLKG
jgi:hypothetical protein